MNKNAIRTKLLFLALALAAAIFFCAHSLYAETTAASENNPKLSDGTYTINAELHGGTGRVSIHSPVSMTITAGKFTFTIVWTSGYYDFMKIGEEIFYPIHQDSETTTFEIPAGSLETLHFTAQTSKMSRPHEIEYSIEFDILSIAQENSGDTYYISLWIAAAAAVIIWAALQLLTKRKKISSSKSLLLALSFFQLLFLVPTMTACGDSAIERSYTEKPDIGMRWIDSEPLSYAKGFAIDYYEGAVLIRIGENGFLFLDSADTEVDQQKIASQKITALQKPSNVYLTATSVMAFMHDIGEIDKIKFAGTKSDGWGLDYAKKALEDGSIKFAGKYSSPDYELLVKENCELGIFSTMITHAPEVSDKMKEVGIPIFVDYSSYENHPLGRTEWIKVYGAIFDKKEAARKVFDEQNELLKSTEELEKTNAEVAFFSISASGKITARKSEDYVAKMIELAGANYAYKSVDDAVVNALTITMDREAFFKETLNSDIIIYNTTINGGFESIAEMVHAHPILAELPAVQRGNVWVTTDVFYQSTTKHGQMIAELAKIIRDETDGTSNDAVKSTTTDYTFFRKLNL